MNKFFDKNGISSFVSIALLLVISVVAVIGFQIWFSIYQSSNLANVDQKSSGGTINSYIDKVIYSDIYFRNEYDNLSLTAVKVDGRLCSVSSQNLTKGLKTIDIGNCLNVAKSVTPEVLLVTDKGLFSKKIYLKNYNGTSYLDCNLDGVSIPHNGSILFYNTSTVQYGITTCHGSFRGCNDGVLTGDFGYIYSTCTVLGQDITPDAFNFTNQTDVELNTVITSETLTLTSYNGTINVLVSTLDGLGNPEFSTDGGSTWKSLGNITEAENLTIRVISINDYLQSRVVNITVGNYTTLWNVTTKDNIITVKLFGDTRMWSNGEIAKNCYDYLNSSKENYLYSGDIGDGKYKIDVDGVNASQAFDVYCDMDLHTGGWMLITNQNPAQEKSYLAINSYDSVVNSTVWQILRENMQEGILMNDQYNNLWYANMDTLVNSSCVNIYSYNSLLDFPLAGGHKVLFHDEDSGCALSGTDYTLAILLRNNNPVINNYYQVLWNYANHKMNSVGASGLGLHSLLFIK